MNIFVQSVVISQNEKGAIKNLSKLIVWQKARRSVFCQRDLDVGHRSFKVEKPDWMLINSGRWFIFLPACWMRVAESRYSLPKVHHKKANRISESR